MEKVWGTFFNAGAVADATTDKLRSSLEGRNLIKSVTIMMNDYIKNNPVEQIK